MLCLLVILASVADNSVCCCCNDACNVVICLEADNTSTPTGLVTGAGFVDSNPLLYFHRFN